MKDKIWFSLLIVGIFSEPSKCSHFRGGIISWKPMDPNPAIGVVPSVMFSWRMSFRRTFGDNWFCDAFRVANMVQIRGEGYLKCDRGCTASLNAPLAFVCTDFSVDENWSSGTGNYNYSSSSEVFDAYYGGSAWVSLVNGGGSSWRLRTHVDLTRRSDNGRINSSPTASLLPVVRIQLNCTTTITIPVSDVDGDIVRCRYANSSNDECGSICGTLDGNEVLDEVPAYKERPHFPRFKRCCRNVILAIPYTSLTVWRNYCPHLWQLYLALPMPNEKSDSQIITVGDTCTILWTPSTAGIYGLAVQIEDFPTVNDNRPLSSIPVQILIQVFPSSLDCDVGPTFVGSTPAKGSCIPISPSGSFNEQIFVHTGDLSVSITSVSTISPVGLTTSDVGVSGVPGLYFVNISWTPMKSTPSQEVLCYLAQDSRGLTSPQVCIFLVTESYPPTPIDVRAVSDDGNPVQVGIFFNETVRRPDSNATIRILQSQNTLYTTNGQSQNVIFDGSNTVNLLLPPGTLQVGQSYDIEIDDGVAATTSFCGILSVSASFYFTVETDGLICPEDIHANGSLSNPYVTVTWPYPILPYEVTADQVVGPSATTATFVIGTKQPVSYIFLTPNNTVYTCDFTVFVGPKPYPCPSDIHVDILVGTGGAAVYWNPPVSLSQTLNDPPTPGTFFETGITAVCYLYYNLDGEVEACYFNILVEEHTPCNETICGNHGTCVPLSLANFTCVCEGCYEGDYCERHYHACDSNPCENGGVCEVYRGSCGQYFCTCQPCFTGQFCQLEVDACSNHQCQNGATCVPDGDTCERYICRCDSCNFGTYCEYEYPDPCEANPCPVGSTCGRLPDTCNSFTCVDDFDVNAGQCFKDVTPVENLCNSFPCLNAGSCISNSTGYECLCREGFGGVNCRELSGDYVDLCQGQICLNGGDCYNSYSSSDGNVSLPHYTCVCQAGYKGVDCIDKTNSTDEDNICYVEGVSMCDNGGNCSNTYSSSSQESFSCHCPIGYIGQQCETTYYDPCACDPCYNGGDCIAFNSYFTCNCNGGFHGPTCENAPEDVTPPSIEDCPDHIIISSSIPTLVQWTYPSVTDNSGLPVLLVDANNSPHVVHRVNTSTYVELVYEDLGGNSATCKFVIVVKDSGNWP